MVQYDFLMANFLAAIMFLLIMSNFGAADDIYGDDFVVIDSTDMENPPSDYDFDLDSIKFTPSYQSASVQSSPLRNGSLIYSANMTFGEDGLLKAEDGTAFGEVAYDVTSREDTIFLTYSNNAYFSDNTQFLLSEQVPPNNTREGITSIPYDEIVGDSPIGLNLENRSTLLIGIQGGTDAFVDVSGGAVSTDSGFFDAAGRTLNNATLAVVEVPRMIGGYMNFVLSVPGLLGSLLRLYFGVLLTILLVDLIWVG